MVGRCRQISHCRLTASRFLTGPGEPGRPAMFLARRCRLQLNFKRGVIKKKTKLPLGVRMLMISAWRNYKYTRPEREREREQ